MFGPAKLPENIIVVIENKQQTAPLIDGGYQLAKRRGEKLIALVISSSGQYPDWLHIAPDYDSATIEIQIVSDVRAERQMLQQIHRRPPALFACCFSAGGPGQPLTELAEIVPPPDVTARVAVVDDAPDQGRRGPVRFHDLLDPVLFNHAVGIREGEYPAAGLGGAEIPRFTGVFSFGK